MSSRPFKVSLSLCLWTFDRKMKMFVVFVILLHESQQVSAVEMFQGDQFLLLPCEFPTFDMNDPKVVWTRQDLSPPTVHQHQPEGDQLKDQNQLYRGRTSMKADALDSGDLSLNLTNLQLSDSGTYTCSIRDSIGELSRTDVELKVKETHFPSWAIAVLVLLVLVLVISAGVLFHHRHYFMSVYQVKVESEVESVLLPCKTRVHLLVDAKVEWKDDEDDKVHVFKNNSDQPEEQDQFYRNRTEINQNLLKTGDLSLILKLPTDQDSRTFICRVSSRKGEVLMKKQVKLKVKVQQVKVEEGAESVLLPFRTTPELPGDSRMRWEDSDDRTVHLYENGSDQPEEQDQLYRTRTRMNEDLLRTGDLSLTLRRPTETDSGRYRCFVWKGDKFLRGKTVNLTVVAPPPPSAGRVQGPDPPEDIRTRTPLMADESV